jgi:DNA-binding transcriptional LysR family regulator
MLDVRRLALLRELATRGTVIAAASALHLTGPAVSQQLAVLEREAGVSLLEKHGRTLRLTPAGRLLVAHADVILANLAQAEADLGALRGGALGTVRLAAFPSAARQLVARLWPSLGLDGLSLQLIELEPERSVDALLQRTVDIALVHSYSLLPRDLPDCDSEHLLDDPVLLAMSTEQARQRRLTPGRRARLSDFADAGWLVPGTDTSCHELVRRACGAAGFVVRPIAQASDFSVLIALARAGAGVALVPRLALPDGSDGSDGVTLCGLRQPITRRLSAITRRGESRRPELRRALDALNAAAAQYLSETGNDQRVA